MVSEKDPYLVETGTLSFSLPLQGDLGVVVLQVAVGGERPEVDPLSSTLCPMKPSWALLS